MPDKLLSLLGLARRAGRLKAGYDLSVETIRVGKAVMAMAASDVSEKTYKNLMFEAHRKGIPVVRLQVTMEALSAACGIKAGVVTLTDSSFVKAITGLTVKEEGQK